MHHEFHMIQPPGSAATNEHDFVKWVHAISKRLVRAGFGTLDMMPMVTEHGGLLLALDTDMDTAQRVRAVLYS